VLQSPSEDELGVMVSDGELAELLFELKGFPMGDGIFGRCVNEWCE
jgi:hypothetical protein